MRRDPVQPCGLARLKRTRMRARARASRGPGRAPRAARAGLRGASGRRGDREEGGGAFAADFPVRNLRPPPAAAGPPGLRASSHRRPSRAGSAAGHSTRRPLALKHLVPLSLRRSLKRPRARAGCRRILGLGPATASGPPRRSAGREHRAGARARGAGGREARLVLWAAGHPQARKERGGELGPVQRVVDLREAAGSGSNIFPLEECVPEFQG